ncbi:MAG: O-antigen ligase [Patescibacteria group bacterium]
MVKKNRSVEQYQPPRHWLAWLIYGCAMLALATPLLSPTIAMLNYMLPKTMAYQTLVELMVVAWMSLAIADRRYRPRWSVVQIALVAFAGVMCVSLAFSLDAPLSFWSTTNRMLGVVTSLHHIAWLFVLSTTLRSSDDWIRLFKISGLVCLLAVVAVIVSWTGDISSQSNVKTLFGNTSYLASYALPHVFLGLFLWSRATSYKKYFWLTLTALAAFAVVLSASRAGIVSLVIAGLIAALGLILVSEIGRTKKIVLLAVSLMIFAVVSGAFFAVRTTAGRAWIEQADVLPSFVLRLATRDFGADRLVLWEMAAKGIAERPLFGWGNEQFYQVHSKYLDLNSNALDVLNESWFDRAHNQYLDYAISYGLIGLTSYLLVWLAIASLWWRAFSRADEATDRRGLVAVGALLLAYLGYSVFFFDSPQLLMVVYLVVAWLIFKVQSAAPSSEVNIEPTANIIAFVGLLVPAIIFAWYANGSIFVASEHFVKGAGHMTVNWPAATEEFRQAFSVPTPYRFELQNLIMEPVRNSIDFEKRAVDSPDGLPEFVGLLTEVTSAAAEKHPHSVRALYVASEAYRYYYPYDESALGKSFDYVERYLAYAPDRHDGHFQMAELEALRGNLDEALRWFDSAYERHHRLNSQYGGFIKYRKACLQARQRNFQGMVDDLTDSLRVFPAHKDVRLMLELGRVIQPEDNLRGLEPYVDEAMNHFVRQPDVLMAGAKIYKSLGNEDMVEQALNAPALVAWGEKEANRAQYDALKKDLGH